MGNITLYVIIILKKKFNKIILHNFFNGFIINTYNTVGIINYL